MKKNIAVQGADTFDLTITGEGSIQETHRTLALYVRDSNQTRAFESPFLVFL